MSFLEAMVWIIGILCGSTVMVVYIVARWDRDKKNR